MRTYKFENGTIFVYGDVDRKRLEKATIQFVKSVRQCKAAKKRVGS